MTNRMKTETHQAFVTISTRELADLIEVIATQSQEVANIVDDLLIAARAEAGTIVIAPQDVSVRAVVGDVLSSHSGRVDFSVADEEDLAVFADPGRMRQILRNLLTNADRYGGDTVKIQVRDAGDEVAIEVRENGSRSSNRTPGRNEARRKLHQSGWDSQSHGNSQN
jgi:signal transduction histidine kinase